jgi:nicotinamide-nucleotide amidase
MHTVSLLMIGSELLDGRVVESNSRLIGKELAKLGLSIRSILICDDVLSEIVSALKFLCQSNRLVLVTGGLGTTVDDLTREAVAELCKVKLSIDNGALLHLKKHLASNDIPESSIKQVTLPENSNYIFNPRGAAPGFYLTYLSTTIICLPGVPSELEAMLDNSVLNTISSLKIGSRLSSKLIRCIGIRESVLGDKVSRLNLSSDKIAYQVKFPEVKILVSGEDKSVVADFIKIQEYLGQDIIFSTSEEENLENIVVKLLKEKGLTLDIYDYCSGGYLSYLLKLAKGESQIGLANNFFYAYDFNKTSSYECDKSKIVLKLYSEQQLQNKESIVVNVILRDTLRAQTTEIGFTDERKYSYSAYFALNYLRTVLS